MNQEKLVNKFLIYMEKGKYNKIEKLFVKNRDNVLFFDELLTKEEFYNDYLANNEMTEEVFKKLNSDIQKKLIFQNCHLFSYADESIRDDREFIEKLKKDIESKEDKHFSSSIDINRYLGPSLSKDKEYISNLSLEDPYVFIDSMDKIDYTNEELKDFFDNHPSYVEELPPFLKNDYEYVANLISNINSNNLVECLSDLDFDYLRIETIKQTIINNSSLRTYHLILLISISNNQKNLSKISPNEFKQMILLCPDAFYDVNKFSKLLSFENQRENINLINEINDVSKLTFSHINTPEKFSQVLFKLSSAINNGLSYEQIYNQVCKNWESILPWIIQIDDVHKLDDGSMSIYPKQEVFTKIHNLLIGIEENKLDDLFKIFVNSELRSSEYAFGIKNINVTDDNLSFLQLACTTNMFCSDERHIDMFNKLFVKFTEYSNDPYQSVHVVNEISINPFLCNLLINVDINSLDTNLIANLYNYVSSDLIRLVKIQNLNDLNNFNNIINEVSELRKKDKFNRLRDKKRLLMLEHFQISLSSAENLIHSYFSSKNSASLYKNYPQILYLKQMIEKVIAIGDENEYNDVKNELENSQVYISFKEIQNIKNMMKKSYGDEIKNSLVQVDSINNVYDYSDKDFNLLVHVTGAYGSTPEGNIYNSWNTKEKTSSVSICSSFISQNNMGIAPPKPDSIILGFEKLPENYLELMSCTDLYSTGFYANRKSQFLTPEELKNNTRHGHNEIVIRRRTGTFVENKVQPSYIVCFDSINEQSREASLQFGVPIIYIDRNKVAKREQEKISAMISEFQTTLNPDLISKIISEQENNRAGLRLIRPDLVELYFSKEFRQHNIETISSIIEQNLLTDNKNAIVCMQKFVCAIEEEQEKFAVTKETPHRKNNLDLNFEFIEKFKSDPRYLQEVELDESLTIEEIYEKFIECRNKLSEKERKELNLLNEQKLSEIENDIVSRKVG